MNIGADSVFKAGVALVVAVVSLYLITLGYSYWWDEMLSVSQAPLGFHDLFFKTILIDVHPPLYPLLLKLWMAVLGSSEFATRSLSVVFIAVALWSFLHNITLLTRNRLEQWLAVLFFVSAWPFLYYGNEVRSYALLLCLSTLTYFRVYRLQQDWLTYGLLVLLALSHYFGLLFALSCLLILFIANSDGKHRLQAVLCGGVLCIWPVLHVIGGDIAGKTGGAFWIEAWPFDAYSKLVDLFLPPYVTGTKVSAACFLVLAGLAVFTYLKKEKALAAATASVWAGLLALSLIDMHSPMTTTRNLICLLPVCAHVLVVGSLRVFGKWVAVALIAVLALMLVQTRHQILEKNCAAAAEQGTVPAAGTGACAAVLLFPHASRRV